MTPIEFNYALKDYTEIKRDEAVFYRQTGFEIGRYISVHIWNSKGRKMRTLIKDEKQILPFPWEKPIMNKKGKQSPEHIAMVVREIARTFNKTSKKK